MIFTLSIQLKKKITNIILILRAYQEKNDKATKNVVKEMF